MNFESYFLGNSFDLSIDIALGEDKELSHKCTLQKAIGRK